MRITCVALPTVVLAAPSLWMLATLPPLWRGVDAYVQTTYPPGSETILLHAPLYCTISRIPLWLGYLANGGTIISFDRFLEHSQLTNPGVTTLIVLQHTALCCAAFYLITACAQNSLVRLCLAGFFAAQPMFYAFAQCVGSETLSMILMVFFAGLAVRIVAHYPDVTPQQWIAATALLCCCILTRKINIVLVALLPIVFTILWLQRGLRVRPGNDWRRARTTLVATALAMLAVFWATSLTHVLCWRTRTPWRPKVGYTFLWRLNFLSTQSATAREQLLERAAAKCKRDDSRMLLNFLGDWMGHNPVWLSQDFAPQAFAQLHAWHANNAEENFDLALNEIARVFLLPPAPPLYAVALRDFTFATRRTQTDVAISLVISTGFFFDHRDKMPQFSHLRTFTMPREQLVGVGRFGYLHWWSALDYRRWLVVTVALLAVALILKDPRAAQDPGDARIVFAICFAGLGAVMLVLNCFLAAYADRFMLPMMLSLLVAVIVILGALLDEICLRALK